MAFKQRDYQYDFVDPLPEECPCPVCLEVQVDPYKVTCCGKIFCKNCLDELIKRKQNCPNCRNNLNNIYFPDLNTERRISQLQVRCENRMKGCEWVGCMKDLKHVHIPECPYHLVPCTNIAENDVFSYPHLNAPECGVLIQRCDLSKHMTQLCKWREVNCMFCKSKGTHQFITGGHTEICQDFLVVCSNEGCEIEIKRKDLPEHKTICPKQIVSCRYSSVGCKARITRENIVSHNQQCMEQHLDSAVDRLDKAFKRIEILEAKTMKHSDVQVEVAKPLKTNWDDSDIDNYDDDDCDFCGDYHPELLRCPLFDNNSEHECCYDCGEYHPDTYRCPRDGYFWDEDDD